MTAEREIFQRSRRRLNSLGWAILFALSLVFGSIYVRDSLKKNLATSQGQVNSRKAALEIKQADLKNIRTHIAEFRLLKQQGLVGNADREAWVEQLSAVRAELKTGDTLSYTLRPPQLPTDPAAGAPAGAAAPAGPEEATAYIHDLDIELGGIHEDEVVALFQEYRNRVRGRFRIQSCRFGNPTPVGMFAQCTLRFFNVQEPGKKP
jgi:hypothetical protein